MENQFSGLGKQGTTAHCCSGVGGLPAYESFFMIAVTCFFFSMSFIFVWSLLSRFYRPFLTLSLEMKADVSSRIVSVIHTLIVVPSLMFGVIRMKWGYHYEPLGDVTLMTRFLCISMGYFMYDVFVLVCYHPPYWWGFIIHHIVACIPYTIYIFINTCSYGLFILACFMFVEATNLSFHLQATLKENDQSDTRAFVITLYITLFAWILFRLINPTFLILVLHMRIIPGLPPGTMSCVIPGMICAYAVCIFCYVIFYTLLKEVCCRWTRLPQAQDVVTFELFPMTRLEETNKVDYNNNSV